MIKPRRHLRDKALTRELTRMRGDFLWVEIDHATLLDRVDDRLRCLLVEKEARHIRQHRPGRATAPIGDHRSAARHRLDRNDAEIPSTWEDQCLATRVIVP